MVSLDKATRTDVEEITRMENYINKEATMLDAPNLPKVVNTV